MQTEEDVAFGLPAERAAEITMHMSTEIASKVVESGVLKPTLFIENYAKVYKGRERDFVLYTAGRLYAEYDRVTGNRNVSTILKIVDVIRLLGDDFDLEKFRDSLRKGLGKDIHRRRGETILSSITPKSEEDNQSM